MDLCPVCGRFDDVLYAENPDYHGGFYTISLNESRKLWGSGVTVFENYPNPSKKGGYLMATYLYPAVFTQEDAGYSVNFPDLPNCFTSDATLEESMDMANDVLCLTLYDLEQAGAAIPVASAVNDVPHGENEFVSLVRCDTIAYRQFFGNTAVKPPCPLPADRKTNRKNDEKT